MNESETRHIVHMLLIIVSIGHIHSNGSHPGSAAAVRNAEGFM